MDDNPTVYAGTHAHRRTEAVADGANLRRVRIPGCWGVMAAAAEHAYLNTSLGSSQVVPEGVDLMAHVKIVDR